MLRWFGQNELDKLAAQGTKLYRCEVPQVNVIASKVQVAFNKNKVISKVELKLGEFLQKEETPTIKKINKFKI
jgi:hypothetical protein